MNLDPTEQLGADALARRVLPHDLTETERRALELAEPDVYNPDRRPTTVVEALARVKAKVPSVGKDRRVQGSESYAYRGIDDILAAVQRHSAEEGIVIIPRDLEWASEEWPYYRGDSWRLYRLHVEWTIYGPDGSSIVTSNWGEALDNGDKALGKARSYAQKDLLVRIYEIPTGDPDLGDTEATQAEAEPTIQAATPEQIADVLRRLEEAMTAADGDYPPGWREARAEAGRPGTYRRESLESMVAMDRPPCPAAAIAVMDRLLAAQTAPTAETAEPDPEPAEAATSDDKRPCEVCGSTRSQRVEHDGRWVCARVNDCAERARKATEGPDHSDEPIAQLCAGCGDPIGTDEPLTYDDDGRTYHAEHNPTLGATT